MPTPLSGPPPPSLRAIWNNTGKNALGIATRPSLRAPSIALSLPSGTGRAATAFVQGIIADPGSAGAKPASVTNGILIRSR